MSIGNDNTGDTMTFYIIHDRIENDFLMDPSKGEWHFFEWEDFNLVTSEIEDCPGLFLSIEDAMEELENLREQKELRVDFHQEDLRILRLEPETSYRWFKEDV